MRIRSVVRIAAVAAALGLVAPITARAQVIVKDNSSPIIVNGVTTYQTDFNDVGGMAVTWTLGGGSQSGTWGSLSGVTVLGVAAPSNAWGIWTEDFKLWGTGTTDTYTDWAWNLWAQNLQSFTLEALPGNGVFDLSNPTPGTDNSSDGKTFNWSGDGPNSLVTYSNPIAIASDAFVGDLYGTLTVQFGAYVNSCPAGWDLRNGQCKQWTGEYVCPSGWTLFGGNDCKKHYNGYWHYDYNGAEKVYRYQEPTQVWDSDIFGNSCDCASDKSPTYSSWWWGTDNTECYETFSQDMDNFVGTPGTPQEVIPEPASMTLLATGLAGIAAAARRRRNKK